MAHIAIRNRPINKYVVSQGPRISKQLCFACPYFMYYMYFLHCFLYPSCRVISKTTLKVAKINRSFNGTSDGPALTTQLKDLEQRVVAIVGIQAATGLVTYHLTTISYY